MKIKVGKNKVIPEICNRESPPYKKAKRLRSPTKTLGDDGKEDIKKEVLSECLYRLSSPCKK